MFRGGWDPEQFASLGSSFDEPDPFAPTPVAPAIDSNLPTFTGTVDPNRVRPRYDEVGDEFNRAMDRNLRPTNAQTMPVEPSAPDAVVKPTPAATAPVVKVSNPVKYAAMIKDISFDATPVYDTPDEAVGNLPSFFSGLDNQVKGFTDKYSWFNPDDFLRSNSTRGNGFIGPEGAALNEKSKSISNFVKENNIPLTQVRDGVTYHLTTGSERDNNTLHGQVNDGIWQEQGPAGTYSTVYIDTSQSIFSSFINSVPASILASVVPWGGAVLTAAKAANGQTLHGTDYLSAGVSAAKGLGMLKAPATAAEAQKIGEVAAQSGGVMAGPIAENAALAGKGLTLAGKTLSYNQSVGLLTAAATGDPKSALVSIYGGDLIKGGLNKAGVTSEALAKVGIPAAAFEAGLQKTVEKVAAGEEFDDALAYGFVDYAREGGLKNLFNMPESDISFAGIEDVVRDIVRPIGTAATAVAKFVKESVPDIDTSAIRQAGRTAEDLVRAGGSAIDDAVIQPVREIAKDLDDAVFRPAGDALSAADTALREVLSEADTAARRELTKLDEGLYDIQSPFSTPDIDLPSIDLPNFNLPSLGMGMGMLLSGAPAPTATTGKIFENELFKFKNKIELTQFGPLNQPEQEVDIEDFLTSPFESAFTTSQRFA
jgi:hypothetical protein